MDLHLRLARVSNACNVNITNIKLARAHHYRICQFCIGNSAFFLHVNDKKDAHVSPKAELFKKIVSKMKLFEGAMFE